MADENDKPIGETPETAWRIAQLRAMERRMLGASASFATDPVFIEPVGLQEPVSNFYGKDLSIIEAATSIIDVSHDPAVATPVSTESLGSAQQAFAADESFGEANVPQSDPSEIQGYSPPPFGGETPQPLSQPQSGFAVDMPPVGQLWPPGLGRPAVSSEEREQVLREFVSRSGAFAGQAPLEPPAQGSRREQGPPASPSPRPSGGSQPDTRPPTPQVGAGAFVQGGSLPDFGDIGSTFYRDNTASQLTVLSQASDATDAIDNYTEMIVELLRRLTLNFLRHNELLNQLLDKADSDDETDEF